MVIALKAMTRNFVTGINLSMIDKKKKQQIIKKFAIHENDTGSAEVQIALLTEEISNLTEHLKIHKKDFSSRRGLLRKVAERRKLLRYLEKENQESFEKLVKRLKLRIAKKAEEKPANILGQEVIGENSEETENSEAGETMPEEQL